MAEIPRVSDRTVSPPPPIPSLLLFSPATSSSNLFLSSSTFLYRLVFLAVYIPLLFIIPFFFFFAFPRTMLSPPSLFLPPCFCLLRKESASYGFYSLVVPPPRIPLSSPPNRPLFPFSIPYASLPSIILSRIARLTFHETRSSQISLILTNAVRMS